MNLTNLQSEVTSICNERFKPLTQIFKGGAHGSVIFCYDKQSNNSVALKKIINCDDKEGIPHHALREVAAYKKISLHQNILNILEVIYDDSIFFVLELMDGTLKDAIVKDTMCAGDILSYKKQILQGISWCHSNQIMHRDIKPHNILLKHNMLKIADFGLARQFYKDADRSYTLEAVTLWYRPIEILLGNTKYREKIDIWSIACVFYEIDHKCPLFASDSQVDLLIKIYMTLGNPSELNFPGVTKLPNYNSNLQFHTRYVNDTSTNLNEIYHGMFSYDASTRPDASHLVNIYETF